MTRLSRTVPEPRGRILPDSSLASPEIDRRKADRDEIAARGRFIFERLRSLLIENYPDWFIAIDTESEDYLLDATLEGLIEKIRLDYPREETRKLAIYRLNETGACGRL